MVVFINNGFVEEEKAVLGIKDLAIQRGYGAFDFFRTSNFIPLFLDEYLDRFFRSTQTLRLQLSKSREELKEIVAEMIRINNIPDSGFKMILTGGYSTDGYELSSPNLIITQQPVQMASEDAFEKGVSIILHEYLRDLPGAKSINYLVGVYLQEKIRQQQADDVLYYKFDSVFEFPRSNVFIVTKDQTVVTPKENVLHGITRRKVLDLASKEFKAEEKAITVDELKNAAEVFLTSTTKRIIPVLKIENSPVGDGKPGEVTTALSDAFKEMEKSLLENVVVTA